LSRSSHIGLDKAGRIGRIPQQGRSGRPGRRLRADLGGEVECMQKVLFRVIESLIPPVR